jgi:hypothetical protein
MDQGSLTEVRLSTVDLLVPTSLDQLLFISQTLLLFYKTSYLNEEVNRTEPTTLARLPWMDEDSHGTTGL